MEATPAGGRPGQTGEMKRAEATMESGNQDLAVTTAKQTADRHRTWSNGVVHWIVANLQCRRKRRETGGYMAS
jgi:phosphatidylethanolamine-binding protein (PEBP) family uncharacterized protein